VGVLEGSPTAQAENLCLLIGQNGRTGAEQLAEHCFRRALKGSARHAELFLNYTEGKPKQGVRHGKPLTRDEWIVMHAGFSNPGEPFSSEGSRKKGEVKKTGCRARRGTEIAL
jgi:hypothetical protein